MQKIKREKRHTPGEQLCWRCKWCDDEVKPCAHFTGNGETIQPFWEEYFYNPITETVYNFRTKKNELQCTTSYRIIKCKNFERRHRGCRK